MIARILAAAGACLLLLASAAQAAPAPTSAAPAAAKPAPKAACNRQCLMDVMEKYLTAMGAHDPKRAPLGKGFIYSENGVELTLPDGLWRTVTKVGDYRLWVVEPGRDVGVLTNAEENGVGVLVSVRLKMSGRTILGAETLVARQDGAATNPAQSPNTAPRQVRPQFSQILKPSERRSRAELIRIADSYFEGLELNTGDQVPPFWDSCLRLENGNQTSSKPLLPGQQLTGINLGCRESIELGYYADDTRMRDRRHLVVDSERGLVYSSVYFDHDATVRSYKLKNGQTVSVARTAPWTWQIHEVFQIRDGKIDQVEAVLLSAQYGQRPVFRDGVRMPSHGR